MDLVYIKRKLLRKGGPLSKEWRDGDSIWSLVSEDRLERTISRIQDLDERGELEAYRSRNDALRLHLGQATVLFASREYTPPYLMHLTRILHGVHIRFTMK